MGKYPIQAGNWLLVVVGIVLVLSGPYIAYRSYLDIRRRVDKKEKLSAQTWASHAFNFLIAIAFFLAGILFVVNNLRGNPLA